MPGAKKKTVKKEEVREVKKLGIPESKVKEYKEAFDLFDKDGSGSIDANEIYKIMKNFGNPLKKDEIKKMIAELDSSGDGELDFDEFIYFMEKQVVEVEEEVPVQEEEPKPKKEEKLRAARKKVEKEEKVEEKPKEENDDTDIVIKAFQSFDKDLTGTITNAEFRYILTQLGDKFTDAEVDTLFNECKLKDDGVLNYKEFVDFWRKH